MKTSNVIHRLIAAFVLAPLASLSAADAPAANPNIRFIFSGDHTRHAISAYGSKVNKTPNIARLAEGGARFTITGNRTPELCGPLESTNPHARQMVTRSLFVSLMEPYFWRSSAVSGRTWYGWCSAGMACGAVQGLCADHKPPESHLHKFP